MSDSKEGSGAGAGAGAGDECKTGGRHDGVISLEDVFAKRDQATRKTKIVCTIGPACGDVETLAEMMRQGMSVARLNFSHGDHESQLATLKNIRKATEITKLVCAVMLDTKGPEIRTGFLEGGESVMLEKDSLVEITTDYTFKGNSKKIACSYEALPRSVSPGQTILAADGNIMMTVVECKETSVIVKMMNSEKLGQKKNMNLPGVIVELPTVTAKDTDDLENFGARHGVDMVAASFVRKGSDIDVLRDTLGPRGRHIKIIAKIENQEGLQNFDDILAKTDGIMVARGDLGMELPPEKVFLAQKMMISKCNIAGKPVITATQMLDSMIDYPRPTRAECTDVANAVLDGSDAVMLSGETAGGKYPLNAVKMMARICVEAESVINYEKRFALLRSLTLARGGISVAESVASSAVKTALDLKAKLIIVCTETGNTARLIAKYNPNIPIMALTGMDFVARQCVGMLKGVTARIEGSMIGTQRLLGIAVLNAKERGLVSAGDYVIGVHGAIEARPGSTNLCKVMTVE